MRAWVVRVAAATAACLLALAVLAGGTAVLDDPPRPDEGGTPTGYDPSPGGIDGEIGSPSPTPKQRPSGGGDDQGAWWLLGLLGVAGVAVSIYVRRRRQPAADEELADDGDAARVFQLTAVALEGDDGSPADAVIACWRELERLVERQGVRRRDTETADEFGLRLASALRLPKAPLTRLGELFDRSWYSQFGTTPADRAEARACLEALRAAAQGRG